MKPILLLEDESNLRKLFRHALRQYRVLEAGTAEEALQLFEENQHGIGLLIADLGLPTSSGIRVALAIRNELPDLPVILTSGFAVGGWSERDARDLARIGAHTATSMMKQFLPQVLLHAVQKFIGQGESERAKTA